MYITEFKRFQQIKHLIYKGLYKEAIEELKAVEEKTLSIEEQLTCLILKNDVLNRLGRHKEALSVIDKTLEKSQSLGNPLPELDIIVALARTFWRLGRLDESFSIIEQGEQLLTTLSQEQLIKARPAKASLLYYKGAVYGSKGEGDKALEFLQQSLTLREEIGDKQTIADSLNHIGGIFFYFKGDYNQALEFFQRSLTLREETGNKERIAICLINIGAVYSLKGELDRALDYYLEHLEIAKEIGLSGAISGSMNNIGLIYYHKGEYEKAYEYTLESLVISEELGDNFQLSISLGNLISVCLETRDLEQARRYLARLEQISKQEDNKIIEQKYRFEKARVLKASARFRDKSKAQEMFKQIIEEEIIDYETIVGALVNLCDLLLFELKTSGEEAILKEVKALTKRLLGIAEEQQTARLLADTYLLQSKLALLELDVKSARQLLTQAQQIAEDKGLQRLVMKISNEYDILLRQLSQWEEFIDRSASLGERFELARLEEMVIQMIRRRILEPPELQQEEPVLILVMLKGGTPLFSKNFMPPSDRLLDDALISGFLSTATAFIQEAFGSSGLLERIKYQDFTILFKAQESLIFIYMFKGQSYVATQRLDKFILDLKNSMWQELTNKQLTQQLSLSERLSMEKIVERIFPQTDINPNEK